MRNFRSFNRNLKAISPIFATLILIAIAVIAGVVVYMFTSGTLSGMTSSGTAGQEKVAVQGVTVDADYLGITVYAQNTAATGTVVVNGLVVKDASGAIVLSGVLSTTAGANDLVAGVLTEVTGDFGTTELTNGVYTVTVTTTGGGSFVSPSFTVSGNPAA